MVLTLSLANILLMPVTILTSINNMAVTILCVLPTSGPTISSQPIFLTYNQDGPGHYDCAVPYSVYIVFALDVHMPSPGCCTCTCIFSSPHACIIHNFLRGQLNANIHVYGLPAFYIQYR